MGLAEWWYRSLRGKGAPAPVRRRRPIQAVRYAAAETDRLMASFSGTSLSANEALKRSLRRVRARARQLAEDNDYARKYLALVKTNVIGSSGISLQARVELDGEPDAAANAAIESAWREWGRPQTCTVTGRLSWRDVQRLAIESVARDGEVLVRLLVPSANPFGFALQILEGDYLDEQLNTELGDGRRISLGVEIDALGRPVAYHLRTQHPGTGVWETAGQRYERVPASEILHLYLTERPCQVRGMSWMATAIRRLQMLGGYEEAELVAARVSAAKMGFFISPDGAGLAADGKDPDGNLTTEAEPGTFEQLPEGVQLQQFDPQHPTTAFDPFIKSSLRGASAGLITAYNSLSNDLEGVNFSSIRSGVLEEREHWRVLQQWLIEQLCVPVYERWLLLSLASGALDLSPSDIERFRSVVWQPRGWAWVDPEKDAKANGLGVALGVQTRAEIAAAQGRDLDEIFEQLAREQERAAELGIDIDPQRADSAQPDATPEAQPAGRGLDSVIERLEQRHRDAVNVLRSLRGELKRERDERAERIEARIGAIEDGLGRLAEALEALGQGEETIQRVA